MRHVFSPKVCVKWCVVLHQKRASVSILSIFVYISMYTGFTLRYVLYMGVSKNSGTPKWMVYNGKPY